MGGRVFNSMSITVQFTGFFQFFQCYGRGGNIDKIEPFFMLYPIPYLCNILFCAKTIKFDENVSLYPALILGPCRF